MKHLFYLMAIFPIMWETLNVVAVKKTQNFIKSNKGKKPDEISGNYRILAFFMIFYTCWILTGLFTFQWPVFIMLFVFGLIPKKYIWYRWIDSFLSLVVLIFIVINAYHFKIDIFKLIFN